MLKEQVRIIREAETTAEKILKEGEQKAAEILGSLDHEIQQMVKVQEELMSKEVSTYAEQKCNEKQSVMEVIKKRTEKQLEDWKKTALGKIEYTAEKVWKEVMNEFIDINT